MMRRMLAALAAAALFSLVLSIPAQASAQPHSWPGIPALPFPHLREGNNTSENQTDTTPPSIAFTSHKDRETVKEASITIRGTSYDEGGVRLVEVMINGGDWVKAIGNQTWSLPVRLEEGSNTIFIRASDLAGNFAELNMSIVLSISTKDNSGIILAAALIIPVVAILLLFATRRKARPTEESPDEHDNIEKRLDREGKKRDESGSGLNDSKEVTRIDEIPKKGGGKGTR